MFGDIVILKYQLNPAETLRRRNPAAPDERNRLAGAQRSRLHLRRLGQEAAPQDRVLQDRTRRTGLSHRLMDFQSQTEAPEAFPPALLSSCRVRSEFKLG